MTANFRDTSPLTTIFVQPVLYALFVWVTKQKQNKRHLSENEKEIILVVKIAWFHDRQYGPINEQNQNDVFH